MTSDQLLALMDQISDEFSEEALNSVLLMRTRLEMVSLNDLKSIQIIFTNTQGDTLSIDRDFTGSEYSFKKV